MEEKVSDQCPHRFGQAADQGGQGSLCPALGGVIERQSHGDALGQVMQGHSNAEPEPHSLIRHPRKQGENPLWKVVQQQGHTGDRRAAQGSAPAFIPLRRAEFFRQTAAQGRGHRHPHTQKAHGGKGRLGRTESPAVIFRRARQ